jgi:ferredoxin-NADP reductase
MTSLALLVWIVGGLLLQLAVYLGVGFWRNWGACQSLQRRVQGVDLPQAPRPDDAQPESAGAAWPGWRSFRVAHKRVEDVSGQVCSFILEPEDGQALPPFLPGQFLTFSLPLAGTQVGAAPLLRCYSLSDAPDPLQYRVSIKRVPAPPGGVHAPGRSSNYFHGQVGLGTLLQVRAPAGHFHLDRGAAPVVLVAGGVGITPLLSMLNGCLAEQPGREIWLFYGVRNSAESVQRLHLESLAAQHVNFHLCWCFSDPLPGDLAAHAGAQHSRVTVELLRRKLPLKPFHFYLCGPTPLLECLVPALEDWGVPEARIHYEAFGPASIPRRSAAVDAPTVQPGAVATPITVSLTRSGRQLQWDGAAGSLLDFFEAHGVAVSSGCRAGGCGTCQTTIQAGQVAYRQMPDYDPEPGSCLLCVCTPKTDLSLEL